ncbi:MAG: glycosyltransferase family 4 protein [Acidobacteriota bacterium]
MRFCSLDTFTLEDGFWQDKMGKPVANQEFLSALLHHGTFESYRFFCDDPHHLAAFEKSLDRMVSGGLRKRVKVHLKARFLEEIQREPPDIMHQGDFTYHMPYLMELRNRLAHPFPVSGVTHSLDGAWMQTRFIQILLARPRPCDRIVCTSRCAKEMLRKAFENVRTGFRESFGAVLPEPPQTAIIPLGLPDRAFGIPERSRCRAELGIPPGHFVMLCLGRLSPRHKMDLSPLLEMVEYLGKKEALSDYTLVIAGGARPEDISFVHSMAAKLGIADRVRIEANASPERKELLYGSADVFISLVDNYQETFGITIVEAMAKGLPVVASDFDGYKDLVAHDLTGFLIPTYASPGDEPWTDLAGILDPSIMRFNHAQKVSFDQARLAEALTALASNPALRRNMGIRACSRSMRYRWSAIVPLYEELWTVQGKEKEHAPQTSMPLLVPDTGSIFSHYPTRKLTEGDRVVLSGYGRERLGDRSFEPIVYESIDAMLDSGCLRLLFDELLPGRARELGGLIERARQATGLPGGIVLMHLDWLMKHGYLSIEGQLPH